MGKQGYNPGDLGWSELTTTSAADALSFYGSLVGWEKMGEPAPGYHVFGRGTEALGGITQPQGDCGGSPRWMPYITVENIEATLAKATELGATIILPPMPLPEDSGHIAIIQDPQGVMTGLAQYNKKECSRFSPHFAPEEHRSSNLLCSFCIHRPFHPRADCPLCPGGASDGSRWRRSPGDDPTGSVGMRMRMPEVCGRRAMTEIIRSFSKRTRFSRIPAGMPMS
ncbi:MAG: VOC family protein [Luteolibacter sp.]